MHDACKWLNHCGLYKHWQAKIETSACLRCYIRVYVVPMSIGLSSSNMPSFHYGHSLAVLSEEIQLLSCVETSLQYILYIGQQSPLVCFVGWPKKNCICIKQSYQVEHSKKLNLSTNIACNERKIIVSWHTNVLRQLRIRIWERSLTLWNKSKCVTCDFVKMSLSTYFTHVTFFNQKLNRYMLIANTNTAIKLFTRSYIYIYLIYFLNMMLLRKYNEYRYLYHLRLRRVFGPLRSS